MNPKTLRTFAVLFAAAGAAVCWHLLQKNPPPSPSSVVPRLTPAQTPNPSSSPESLQWADRETEAFKRTALQRAQKWLTARGRDAGSLIAVWDVIGDDAILAEAAEKFPNDPRVCLAMIHSAGQDAKKALPWIERLIAAEPKNPQGQYLKAWALMDGGDRPGALASLREAVSMKAPRDNHLKDRIMTAREGLLASGTGLREAAMLSLSGPMSHSPLYTSLNTMYKTLRLEIEATKAAGNDARLLEISGLGLAVAERFTDTSGGLAMDSIVVSTMEKLMLTHLSDDVEIGTDGKTVAQMKQDADARRKKITDYLEQEKFRKNPALETFSDAVISEYTDRFVLHGEVPARTWLMQQTPAKSPP